MTSITKTAAGTAFCLLSAVAGQAQCPKDTYLNQCSICHGEDGAAKTAKGRNLKMKGVNETVGKYTEAELIKIATDAKVTDMDGFGKSLAAAQIKGVVEYYRSLARK